MEARALHKLLVTMEENVASGGFGEKVRDFTDRTGSGAMLAVHIPDAYVEHGNVELLKKELGMDADSVVKSILAEYSAL